MEANVCECGGAQKFGFSQTAELGSRAPLMLVRGRIFARVNPFRLSTLASGALALSCGEYRALLTFCA
jgi:hypothetical protein